LIDKPGSAEEYKTGAWRTYRPQVDVDKCINCLRCWLLCPDMSIYAEDGRMAGYDYDHCKGCGICAKVCPVAAIEMILEEKVSGRADERGRYQSGEKKKQGEGVSGKKG
jgi:pyruvate ferredoxin oxidoreductase delta subunit